MRFLRLTGVLGLEARSPRQPRDSLAPADEVENCSTVADFPNGIKVTKADTSRKIDSCHRPNRRQPRPKIHLWATFLTFQGT